MWVHKISSGGQDTLHRLSEYPPVTFLTPTKNLPDTYQTSSRQPPKMFSKHLPETLLAHGQKSLLIFCYPTTEIVVLKNLNKRCIFKVL